MSQRRFPDLECSANCKQTRRDRFLEETDAITRWAALVEVIEPHHPKEEKPGRPPIGLEGFYPISADGLERAENFRS